VPPVIAGVAAGIGAYTSGFVISETIGLLGSAIIVGVATTGLQFLSQALAPKPKRPELRPPVDKGITQLIRGSSEPRKVIYGERPVSGVLVFAEVTGSSKEFLHMVVVLAGHQVQSIGTVFLNDEPIDDSDMDANGNVGSGRFNAHLRIKKYLGHDDQTADPDLVSEVSSWTTEHRLRGIAYLYLRLKFNRDIYPTGIPNVKAMVKGRLIADPRDTSISITSSSVATQTVITTASTHGLSAGDRVFISGHTGSTPEIKGEYQVISVPTTTTFTIDVNVTVGGTGGSLLKMKWTDNAALCLRDYLVSSFGLLADPIDEINDTSFITAANICDEEVNLPSTIKTFDFTVDPATDVFTQTVASGAKPEPLHPFDGVELTTTGTLPAGLSTGTRYYAIIESAKTSPFTFKLATSIANARAGIAVDVIDAGTGTHTLTRKSQPRYTTNGVISLEDRPIDIATDLIVPTAGALTYMQGKYAAFAGAYYGPATISLNEDDLRDKMVIRPRPGKSDIHNGVRGTFADRDNGFLPTDFPPIINSVFLQNDKNEKIFKDVEFPFITDTWRAQRIAKLINIRDREGLVVEYPAKLTALQIAIMDVIKVSNERLQWTDKEFEVLGWKLTEDGGVDLLLKETAASIYSFNADTDQTVPTLAPNTGLPRAFDPPDPPTGVAISTQLIIGGTGATQVMLRVSWTPPNDHLVTEAGKFEIQWKKSADNNYEPSFFVDGRKTFTFIGPFDTGNTYDVRIRSVKNPGGITSTWASVAGFTAGPSFIIEDLGNVKDPLTPIAAEDWGLITDTVADSRDYNTVTVQPQTIIDYGAV